MMRKRRSQSRTGETAIIRVNPLDSPDNEMEVCPVIVIPPIRVQDSRS